MITQRTQYRFVTPPGGVLVNGGILPARDAAGGGTSGELRGEDLCFLAEAGCRAKAYRTYDATQPVPELSEEMSDIPAYDTAIKIRGYPSCSNLDAPSEPSYGIPGAPVVLAQYVKDVGTNPNSPPSLLDTLRAVLGNAVSQFVPASPEYVSGELDADAIRRMYYDLRKSGCFVHSGRIGKGFSVNPTYVLTEYDWDSGNHEWVYRDERTVEDEGYMGVITLDKSSHTTWGGYSSDYSWTLSSLPPVSGASGLARLHGADVGCHAVFHVFTRTRSAGHVDALVVNGSIGANGAVTIDPLTASGVRALIAGAQGIPVTWNDLPDLSMVDASLSPLALIFHDPGIDTSGINWNWTPT